ncbi:MAG TPA: hypothetical protein VK592_06310 [Candidatus Dormibacteraeota bacterium]|nr:hypothetical protein [Candidatus Dormibacteraeota bacterium]
MRSPWTRRAATAAFRPVLSARLRVMAAVAALAALGIGAGGLRAASDGPVGATPGDGVAAVAGWRAGETDQLPLDLDRAAAESLAAGGVAEARRLGLPGVAAAASRALDRTIRLAIDTIELRDPDGHAAAVLYRDAASGRLRSAVRLAWTPDLDTPRLDAAAATRAAGRFLAAAGWAVPSTAPLVSWDDGMDAWRVRWPRRIAGVEAPSNGSVAWIHRAGQLKALAVTESPLAAAPAQRIAPEAALASVRGYMARVGLDRMAGLAIEAPVLRWAEANDFIDPGLPDAPALELRLAWVVHLSYLPPGWTERHEVELAVDAGSGALIGGTETA